jgi:D-galactarolactone cycloisomerase
MKITQLQVSLLEYPLPHPLKPSWAPGRTFTTSKCSVIRLHTDEGIVGVGAGPDVGATGLYTFKDMVAPYILGRDPFLTEQISPFLRNASRDGSYPWAIEMALWDIIGQTTRQPIYRLWGGYQKTLPAYASMAEIASVEDTLERIHLLRAMGFRAVKLRLRRATIKDDIALVERVRREFGDDFQVMVDANQAHVMPCPDPYRFWTYEEALQVARAMEQLGVVWLEEPLPRYNLKQLARLAAEVDIPIAGGELNLGLHEYKTLIDQDCYDIIQADGAFSEGIFQLRKVAALAELSYKKFIPHTWSNGIGLASNLHLGMSVPNCPWFEFPIDPPGWTIEARDFMLTTPITIARDGTITVPETPGLGVTLNEDAIIKYTTSSWASE